MREVKFESMSGVFHKIHVQGAPSCFVLHEFTGPDEGDPHDHPFDIEVTILKGGYIERIWSIEGHHADFHRVPGDSFTIPHDRIHRIVALMDGPCLTLASYGPWVRDSGFWQFRGDGSWRKPWNGDWVKQ